MVNRNWQSRTSEGVRPWLSGRDTVLLISVHDIKADGPNNIIGFTLVQLRPGTGVNDSWHPLLAGPAYMSAEMHDSGEKDHESKDLAGHAKLLPISLKERVQLRGHSGAVSSIHLKTTYRRTTN